MISAFAAVFLNLGISTIPATDEFPVAQEEAADAVAVARDEFDSAFTAWQKQVRAAKSAQARRALRKQHPVQDFLPVFARLADEGHGRALLWIVEHLEDAGGTAGERTERRLATYERLLTEHVPGPLVADIGKQLFADRTLTRSVGAAGVEALGLRMLAVLDEPEPRAATRFALARFLTKAREEKDVERGAQALEELLKEFPTAPWSEEAADLLFVTRHLRVGCVAPDFTGHTVDGDPVRLSDYRGRVVALDFFGFW